MSPEHRFAIHIVLVSLILILTIVIVFISISTKNVDSQESSTFPTTMSTMTSANTQPLQTWFTTTLSFLGIGGGGFGGGGIFSVSWPADTSSTTSWTTATTLYVDTCPFSSAWINDGYCDDQTNIADCLYDGGDCCLERITDRFCDVCICHETGVRHQATTPLPTASSYWWSTTQGGCLDHRLPMVGDGYCDDVTNDFLCDYDGGDCCVDEPNHEFCLICACKEGIVPEMCFTNYLGDQFCDDMNNIPECGYDHGDCCGEFVNTQYCSVCACFQK